MRSIEHFKFEPVVRTGHGEAMRDWCTLGQDAGKIRRRPNPRKIDTTIVKAVGINEARDQSKREIGAVDRVCVPSPCNTRAAARPAAKRSKCRSSFCKMAGTFRGLFAQK